MTFSSYLLTVLALFGGRPGPPQDQLVRFALGALLWGTLLAIAWKRRDDFHPREKLLLWGFGAGFFREAFMFGVFSLELLGLVRMPNLHILFPPFEHLLLLMAFAFIGAAFIRYQLDRIEPSRRYLRVGLIAALATYAGTFLTWARFIIVHPESTFGQRWEDWVFHLVQASLLAVAMALFLRSRGWKRRVLLTSFGIWLLTDLLMIWNLATRERYIAFFDPVRHTMHLMAIAGLAYLYFREIREERNQAVTELRESLAHAQTERNKTEAVIAAIGDGLCIVDTTHRVLFQNAAHLSAKGNQVGRVCYEAMHGRTEVCAGCPVARSMADGTIQRVLREPSDESGGTWREITSSPLRDADGSIVGGVELVRDVTDRVRTEEMLRKANERLERQNEELRTLDRMKDGLIRDVTHELKTPVAKQAMQLELLRTLFGSCGSLPDDVPVIVAMMGDTVHRQERLIHNLLDLSRLEAGGRRYRREAVALEGVLRDVLADYAFALEKAGIAMTLDLAPVTVVSDGTMLQVVFTNLVDNAVKYRRSSGPALTVTLGPDGTGGAVATVADNGIGMPPDTCARAFDRFYQASANSVGSGVGLSIARIIVENLGGTINLASAGPGQGTCATVRLPPESSPVSPLDEPA